MAFTRSLYYPWIDIQDDQWLKSAALYWEKIQTIVPETINNPYSTNTAQYLEEKEILVPLRVHSDMDDIEELTQDVAKYMKSQEGMELLTRANRKRVYLHPDKLPRSIRHLSHMHPDKISHKLRYMLEESGLGRQGRQGFIEVDEEDSLRANPYSYLMSLQNMP